MRWSDASLSAAGSRPDGFTSRFVTGPRRWMALSTLALLSAAATAQSAPDRPSPQADYGKLPLSFEANQGQVDKQVRFTSRGNGYSLFLTDNEAVLALSKNPAPIGKNAGRRVQLKPTAGLNAAPGSVHPTLSGDRAAGKDGAPVDDQDVVPISDRLMGGL